MTRNLAVFGLLTMLWAVSLVPAEACPERRRSVGFVTPVVIPESGDTPQKDAKEKPKVDEKITLPQKAGFWVVEAEGRWWIFREGSKDLAAFKKTGEPEKSYTRINAEPYRLTLRAPDIATMEEYLTARAGFVTKFDDGRIWVFRAGSQELAAFLKDGELAKHVIRPGAGPRGMTLKGPDAETLNAYLKAPDR